MTRKLGRTLEQFRAHYENKHLPLGHRTLPQIVEHCMNYVDQRGVMFPPGSSIPRLPRPGITRSRLNLSLKPQAALLRLLDGSIISWKAICCAG